MTAARYRRTIVVTAANGPNGPAARFWCRDETVRRRRREKNNRGEHQVSRTDTDEGLLEAIGRQERDALESLYRRWAPRMGHVLRQSGVATDDIDDVLQIVFWEVWRTAARYRRQKGSAAAWLFQILRRRAIDHLRRTPAPTVPLDGEEGLQVIDPAPDPVVAALATDALAQLAPRERALVELLYFGGFTQQEVAQAWRVPLGTVKTWAFRAMAKLREWDRRTAVERQQGESP